MAKYFITLENICHAILNGESNIWQTIEPTLVNIFYYWANFRAKYLAKSGQSYNCFPSISYYPIVIICAIF